MSGNLVDETATLGRPREHGHPMEDFHEYFASAITTLSYDGGKFFANLQALKRLSQRSEGAAELYRRCLDLLREVRNQGAAVQAELSAAGFPNSARLERNLSRLEGFLKSDGRRLAGRK